LDLTYLGAARRDYEGGYYFMPQDLIRTGIHTHTAAIDDAISQTTLDGVNLVQETPWKVNDRILDTMMGAFHSGMEVGDLPYHDKEHVPSKDDDEWEQMSDEEKADWKRELSQIHGRNARLEGRRKSFASKINVARSMRSVERFYFPHFLDFRGRVYPMPTDLHPQADDCGKALLMFADGKPLGTRGFYWLRVQLANTFGEDKLSLDERAQWAEDHMMEIMDSADDPLDGMRFWEQADDPFQFLAAAFEFTAALSTGDPASYVSYLPINMDGSCNGLQHLSAMGRDRVGAVATNVANNQERQDIYMQVAEKVAEKVSRDAANGVEEAHQWVGQVNRKTVKRAVMTTPYGVTARGISDQLVADGHTKGMDKPGKAAVYLRNCIQDAVDETVVSAKQIMGWIQDLALALSRHGVPFDFTTPTGNKIRQSYWIINLKRIMTLYGKLAIWEEDPFGGLNDRKQTLASAPNLIHAFDASHLIMTVIRMYERVPDASFAMIHDSFGCHACDVDELNATLRETFADIYADDWLERVYQEALASAPDAALPHWSEYVTLGDFDVEECIKSEFFFS
jgi:DNA-directed RNA polymerase